MSTSPAAPSTCSPLYITETCSAEQWGESEGEGEMRGQGAFPLQHPARARHSPSQRPAVQWGESEGEVEVRGQ